VRIHPLPYEDLLDARPLQQIDLVVVHCTELPDLASARGFGERVLYPASGTGNSGHWYIDRDGRVERWVDPARVAHHVRGFNARSVGIELVNGGRWPDWLDSRRQAMEEPYPDAQIEALMSLLATLSADLPALRWITGHEDLDTGLVPASDDPSVQVRRKLDPGPLFPWARILAATPLRRLEEGERRESARRGSV
jgi:N-acetylmuramoyl-L-alanine amidase